MLLAVEAAALLVERSDSVDIRWAVSRAAYQHAVDPDELALLLLQKFVNVQRARAALASIREGDLPAPAPKRIRVRRRAR
jgi:hypothetical protein